LRRFIAGCRRVAPARGVHKGHLGPLSRDLNLGVSTLEAFARNQTKTPPETILHALARTVPI